MDEQIRVQEIKVELESFLGIFNEYAAEIFTDNPRRTRLDELRAQLLLQEPQITAYVLDILGNFHVTVGPSVDRRTLPLKYLLVNALIGGNTELPINFSDYKSVVITILTKAIGSINAGLWPPQEPKPILIISDSELKNRCSDLLLAPNNYDRVIREATIVLEDRIRNKLSHDVLSRLIPQSADQTGDNLVNTLFSPTKPILSISNEKPKQIAFHRILLGVFSYLRNPYHHKLDPRTEWSWAWSTVGLIDRLLAEIEACVVLKPI